MNKLHKLNGHFAEQSGLPWQAKLLLLIGGAITLLAFTGCGEVHRCKPCVPCSILHEQLDWSVEASRMPVEPVRGYVKSDPEQDERDRRIEAARRNPPQVLEGLP